MYLPFSARAKPARFRRSRVTVAGCGQVGLALLGQIKAPNFNATYRPVPSRLDKAIAIRSLGARPFPAELSNKHDLFRLACLSNRLIWLAAPNTGPFQDNSLKRLSLFLSLKRKEDTKASVSYVSTTGVYGNTHGNWIDEKTRVKPDSARAQRRVQAEIHLKTAYRHGRINVKISRAPGIYSESRLPLDRLRAGTPALAHAEDSFSNHIHELDLARIAYLMLYKGRPWNIVNAVDSAPMKMGDYFDMVADRFEMPRPMRMPSQEVKERVSPMMWSFMSESRRIRSTELARLNISLIYPTVKAFLGSLNQVNS